MNHNNGPGLHIRYQSPRFHITRIPKLRSTVPSQSVRLMVVRHKRRRNRTVQREITPLWGEKKVVLRQTLRAVSRLAGSGM